MITRGLAVEIDMDELHEPSKNSKDRIERILLGIVVIAFAIAMILLEAKKGMQTTAVLLVISYLVGFMLLPLNRIYQKHRETPISNRTKLMVLLKSFLAIGGAWAIFIILGSSIYDLYWSYWVLLISYGTLQLIKAIELYFEEKHKYPDESRGKTLFRNALNILLLPIWLLPIMFLIYQSYTPPYQILLKELERPEGIAIVEITKQDELDKEIRPSMIRTKGRLHNYVGNSGKISALYREMEEQKINNLTYIEKLNYDKMKSIEDIRYALIPICSKHSEMFYIEDGHIPFIEMYPNGRCYVKGYTGSKRMIETFRIDISKEAVLLLFNDEKM
ncbi:hypothetical protein HNQ80_004814 [Anaerosolibacter carboniphilus]|uniref:Uncharacterized protein n=1 Tax=Anaerosolibacter carboniphilus TaxID=1417629 RepID=A0A841L393_9FIRM|nr:hypothetical protein [Anaerosolibacter carboniphilus]MBB6218640.1 hypothetical protein [Anaerosolibacter carboniphilus]